MPQAYEGYLEKGRFYPITPITIQGRRRVIITVLDRPINEEHDTWAELDKIVLDMSEKPRFEDFQRSQSGRELINVEEA